MDRGYFQYFSPKDRTSTLIYAKYMSSNADFRPLEAHNTGNNEGTDAYARGLS